MQDDEIYDAWLRRVLLDRLRVYDPHAAKGIALKVLAPQIIRFAKRSQIASRKLAPVPQKLPTAVFNP